MPAPNLSHLDFFDRYRPIVDDWEAFVTHARKPLPATIWTNTLKTAPDDPALRDTFQPISWYPGAYRCPPGIMPAALLPYAAGHYQIQEEAALLPVHLLSPQPGETVLDMCAAPGNKTAQMAVAMASSGLVVANDRSRARLGILRRAISRLGLTNVAMTVHDATSFPGEKNAYDRVLADVPCSGEGTIRRYNKTTQFISKKRRSRLNNIQQAILTRAIALCKPGGLIAYATCTFAPEENEQIIDRALSAHEGGISLAPVSIDGFKTLPGLTSWEGTAFHPDLRHAVRVWPHHNDTGGFFVALIQKAPTSTLISDQLPGEQIVCEPLFRSTKVFQDRFGIASVHFDGLSLQQFGKFLYIRSFDALPPRTPEPIQTGMPFCRPAGESQKMKTGAAMLWGRFATKNVVDLSARQALRYAAGEVFGIASSQIEQHTSPGYVLLKLDNMHLGLGLLRKENGDATIESLLPRHWIHTR